MTTSAELLKLAFLQDSRWSKLIDHATANGQDTSVAKQFFLRKWSPYFAKIMNTVPGLSDSQSRVGWNEILSMMNAEMYPAARQAGLPDSSFVLPDITVCNPTVGGVMSVAHSFYDIVSSDEALALATAVNPGLGMALGTAMKASELVSRAKDGDKEALAKLKAVRIAADSGSPAAIASVKEMNEISKAQDAKAASKKSFWGGLISIGADHRAGVNPLPKLPKGLAVRPGKTMDFGFNLHKFYPELNPKSDGSFPTAAGQKAWKDYQAFWANPTGAKPATTNAPKPPPRGNTTQHTQSNLGSAPAGYVWMVDHWERGTPTSLEATAPGSQVNQYGWPVGVSPPIDPMTGQPIPYATYLAQQQAQAPYGNPYGQYPYPPYQDPYAMQYGNPYGQYQDPYAAQYGTPYGVPPYNPYPVPNPYDYGADPISTVPSQSQVYDPTTGMFYSNQVNEQYDAATDSFVPVVCYNPYNPGY